MSKHLKTATALVILGLVIFAAVMAFNGFNFSRIFKKDYQTNIYNVTDSFSDISLSIDTADVVFLKSNDGKCKIECYEDEDENHIVEVQENTLTVKVSKQKWYQNLLTKYNNRVVTRCRYLCNGRISYDIK